MHKDPNVIRICRCSAAHGDRTTEKRGPALKYFKVVSPSEDAQAKFRQTSIKISCPGGSEPVTRNKELSRRQQLAQQYFCRKTTCRTAAPPSLVA